MEHADLQGWKEIAQYLGKSVRAAQRWEAELGLPVHRMKTTGGQIIYARRREIDAWRARQELPAKDPAPADVVESKPASDAAPPAAGRTWGRSAIAIAVLALVSTAVALLLNASGRTTDAPPQSYAFSGNALVATSGGREVWRKAFDRTIVVARAIGFGQTPFPAERIHAADIDGDGTDEILAVISYSSTDIVQGDELYCFSPRGEVRWVYTPKLTMRFGAGSFEAPWYISAIAVAPAGVPREVYLALTHHTWWPSAVVRVRPDGTADMRLVHAGHLYALTVWDGEGGRRIAAGGINNEHGAAAVAVLDDAPALRRSPQTPGSRYECAGCGTEPPLKYFVFERSEVNQAGDSPYNRVGDFHIVNGELGLQLHEDAAIPGADQLFRISRELRVASGSIADSYWIAHRRHEQEGRLTHRVEDCAARRASVRLFDGTSGWTRTVVPLDGAAPGAQAPRR